MEQILFKKLQEHHKVSFSDAEKGVKGKEPEPSIGRYLCDDQKFRRVTITNVNLSE